MVLHSLFKQCPTRRSLKNTSLVCGLLLFATANPSLAQPYKFDFGSGPVAAGYKQVLATSKYTPAAGFGFDSCSGAIINVNRGGTDSLRSDFCTSGNDKPFSFSFNVPEGNYRVSVTIGDLQGPSEVTVNAESHRLMLEKIRVPAGQFVTKTFIVNRRSPQISTGGAIGLKTRAWPNTNEPDMLNWDGRLTLEFCDGHQQNICAVEAVKIDTAIQVFLAGNSTVTDQEYSPWGSWGQMIPRFFSEKVVIVNLAESGLASTSFGNRLDKATSMMKAGDYCFLEFGHNDNDINAYNTNMTRMINAVKAKNGIPVIVSPICRRSWDATGKIDNTTGQIAPYSAGARTLAANLNVALVDLTAMTKSLLDALGQNAAPKLYVSYTQAELTAHSWTRFTSPPDDHTHTNVFGAYEYAKCVREGIKKSLPTLAQYLLTDVPAFDPTKPDDAATWFASWTWSPYPEVRGSTVVSNLDHRMPVMPEQALLSIEPGSSIISYVNPTDADQIMFSIYSIDGKQIAQKQVAASKVQGTFVWNRLNGLHAGAYFLEMKIKGNQVNRISFTKM